MARARATRRVGAARLRVVARRRSPSAATSARADATTRADLAERGIGVVRRPTGGRALLHHREITYSVTAPVGDAGRSARRRTGASTLLRRRRSDSLGVAGRSPATPRDRAPAPGHRPCFAEPAAGELTRRRAQARRQRAVARRRRAAAARLHPRRRRPVVDSPTLPIGGAPMPAPATLRDALGRAPVMAEVADALFDAVRELDDRGRAAARARRRSSCPSVGPRRPISDDAWTWRR